MPGSDTARPPVYRGARAYLVAAAVLALLYLYRYFRVDDFAGANRANLVLFYAIVALGFYFVFGVSGQLAISQAAFVGVGAYASNWASRNHSFALGLLAAIVCSAVIAAVLGWLLRKTDHFYFAIATLAFSEITLMVFRNWRALTGTSLTGGDISGAKTLELFGYTFDNDLRVFTLLFVVVALILLLCIWFVRSPLRREAIAARDNPMVSRTLGIPVQSVNLRVFVLGSTLAGIAGSLFVHWNGFANVDSFGIALMLAIMLMVIVGGAGSYWGAIIGALFYVYVPVFIERLEQYREIFFGAILMVTMIVMPEGIIGVANQVRSLVRRMARRDEVASVPDGGSGVHALRRRLLDFRSGTPTGPAVDEAVSDTTTREKLATFTATPSPSNGSDARPPIGAPVLEASDIAVTFGGVKAVDHVDLDLREGEILGLVGPNGSGKSSFLNALTGVVPATGQLRVRGREVALGNPRAVRAASVLRTFQTPQTFLHLSCIENVLLAERDRRYTGLAASWLARPLMLRNERARWARAQRALERFGLAGFAERSAAGLAYGQQRMLELARVLAGEPDVVLLDEPSAGLNATETEMLAAHLQALRAEGISLLVVDHKIDFITSICDRVAVLEWGKLVTVAAPDEVWRDERVVAAYLGTE